MNAKTLKTVRALLGLLILGSVAYLYFLMREAGDRWPKENDPGSLTAHIKTLQGSIAQLRAQEARIPERRARRDAVAAEFETASAVLPRESSPEQLIAAIRTKARQAGVTPTSLQPGIAQAASGARRGRAGGGGGAFEIWRFPLAITGSYDQIADFVNRMEEFESPDAERTGGERRFFEVTEITIEAQASGLANLANLGGEGSVEPIHHRCSLVVQTYRYTGGSAGEDGVPPIALSVEELRACQSYVYSPGGRDPMTVRLPAEPEPEPEPALARREEQREEPRRTPTREEREEMLAAEFAALGLRIDGVTWSPTDARAMVGGQWVSPGEAMLTVRKEGDLRVESIEELGVVFRYKGMRFRLPVELFSGKNL